MFTALASNLPVRLGSSTNSQGTRTPAHYIAFAELKHACPLSLIYHFRRRTMNPLSDGRFTAFIGIGSSPEHLADVAARIEKAWETVDSNPTISLR